jgi:hypothetical protein
MGKYLKMFQKQVDFTNFQNSENWRLPNVSYIIESPKMTFKKKVTTTTFGIDGSSYTIPGEMTWQELFESDIVVQHNAVIEGELNHFVGYCEGGDDCCFNYLYLDGSNIATKFCDWWSHLGGGCGCMGESTHYLYDDSGNKVNITDKIKSISYQIQ